ncbi:MAG: hypothetical protein AMXMBFR77_04500 [Phycisphaerales bacterium]|nr:MAG: hypothetical protein BroJett004_23170 [Planctomycetota bacterium]
MVSDAPTACIPRATAATVQTSEVAIGCSNSWSGWTIEAEGEVFHGDGRFTRDGFPAPA